jgi:hypothetical protein
MIDFAHSFPNGDDSAVITGGKSVLIATIDAEWLSNYTKSENLILSYQFSVIDLKTGNRGDGIYYTNWVEKERLTITQIIEQIGNVVGLTLSKLNGYTIVVVAHNAIAEWSAIKNRNKLNKQLQMIRKTVITPGVSPIILKIYDENRNKKIVKFMLKDTMLLVPELYRSLKKASILVDPEFAKLDLTKEELSNMLKLLQDNPVRFETYAIRDTQVTLKLWITLQCMLNEINGTKDKIFSTLSSAALSRFKSKYVEEFGGQDFEFLFRRKK